MEQNRIIEIDHDSYVLPDQMTDKDVMNLLSLMPTLMRATRVSDRMTYIPDKDSEYGTRVIVRGERTMKIEIRITPDPVLTKEEFEEKRAAGQAEYEAAHPKPAAPVVADGETAK